MGIESTCLRDYTCCARPVPNVQWRGRGRGGEGAERKAAPPVSRDGVDNSTLVVALPSVIVFACSRNKITRNSPACKLCDSSQSRLAQEWEVCTTHQVSLSRQPPSTSTPPLPHKHTHTHTNTNTHTHTHTYAAYHLVMILYIVHATN